MVYKWFDVLKKDNQHVISYVIMPNHLHVILYFPEPGYNRNKIIGNAKRFMAYEIIKRLEEMRRNDLLEYLFDAVTKREKKKAQRHRVFDESFDAKGISSEKFKSLRGLQNNSAIKENCPRGVCVALPLCAGRPLAISSFK